MIAYFEMANHIPRSHSRMHRPSTTYLPVSAARPAARRSTSAGTRRKAARRKTRRCITLSRATAAANSSRPLPPVPELDVSSPLFPFPHGALACSLCSVLATLLTHLFWVPRREVWRNRVAIQRWLLSTASVRALPHGTLLYCTATLLCSPGVLCRSAIDCVATTVITSVIE